MAVDEALFEQAHAPSDEWQPTIRLYQWDRPVLTLGRLQRVDASSTDIGILDRERCRELGVEVVRRPTGGRAILHHPDDITYSIIASVDDANIGRDVMGSYRNVNNALVRGLQALGIRATVRERPPAWPDPIVDFACFERAHRHEVYWTGRKLAASAQRRRGPAVLQQGTIPGRETGDGIAALLELDPARRSRLRRDLAERTGTLARALDRLPALDETTGALTHGFRDSWGTEFEPGVLTPEEIHRSHELAATEPTAV